MDISFRPDLEVFITEQVRTGAYSDPSELVNEALLQFRHREEFNSEDDEASAEELAAFHREIQAGIDASDRGDVIRLNGDDELADYFEGVKNRGMERLRAKQADQ